MAVTETRCDQSLQKGFRKEADHLLEGVTKTTNQFGGFMEAIMQSTTVPFKDEARQKWRSLPFTERADKTMREEVAAFEKEIRAGSHRIAKDYFSESVSAEHVHMACKAHRPGSRKKYAIMNSIGGLLLSAAVGKGVVLCGSAALITPAGFLLTFAIGATGLCLMVVALAKS